MSFFHKLVIIIAKLVDFINVRNAIVKVPIFSHWVVIKSVLENETIGCFRLKQKKNSCKRSNGWVHLKDCEVSVFPFNGFERSITSDLTNALIRCRYVVNVQPEWHKNDHEVVNFSKLRTLRRSLKSQSSNDRAAAKWNPENSNGYESFSNSRSGTSDMERFDHAL